MSAPTATTTSGMPDHHMNGMADTPARIVTTAPLFRSVHASAVGLARFQTP